MKKFESFCKSLDVLKTVDFEIVEINEIYRMGVIALYWQTFELAWKAMKSVLQLHGVDGAKNGSPREVIKLGFAFGFVDDEASWLAMLRDRNTSAHKYNEDMAELVLERIQI